ncbi:MAG: site-2 protease family protein [Cyclobacteriaceae bacterium]|nr:site-2 protease family protein [Cyclobacteriaceae bacterium]
MESLLIIALIIVLYYLGQFLLAIIFDVHNDHYFIGFGPKLFSVKIFDVVISVGIYLPIPGLSRIYKYESSVKKKINLPWEFHEHPIWKRFIVTMGGSLSVFLIGIICFIMFSFFEKDQFLSKEDLNRYGIEPSKYAKSLGFQRGDKIIKLNGYEYERASEISNLSDETVFTLQRKDSIFSVNIEKEAFQKTKNYLDDFLLNPLIPAIIDQIEPFSPAEQMELKKGDRFVSINGDTVISINDIRDILAKDTIGAINALVERVVHNDTILIEKSGVLNEDKLIGFSSRSITVSYYQNTLKESFFKGIINYFTLIKNNVRSFYYLLSGSSVSSKTLSGPIRIADNYSQKLSWVKIIKFIGLYSISILFFDLLPFPKSTMIYVLPLFYEAITRKRFSVKAAERLNKTSIVLIVVLMLWVVAGDLLAVYPG